MWREGVFNPPATPILAFPRQREKEQMTEFLIYAPCCQQRVGWAFMPTRYAMQGLTNVKAA